MDKYAIGSNVYKRMKELKITQAELAEQLRVNQSTVSNWMNGIRQPGSYALYRMSKILGVTMEQLMEGIEG